MHLFSLVIHKTWYDTHPESCGAGVVFQGAQGRRADSNISDEGLQCRKKKHLNFDL